MFDTRIAHISYYIPENSVPVKNILSSVSTQAVPTAFSSKEAYANFITADLRVPALRMEETLSDKQMLCHTVEQLFIAGHAEPEEIDLIILAQEEDQRQTLNLGQFIQYEFDMRNAYVLNVSGNHCANMDHALTLASQLACNNGRINTVLILGNVKITNPAHRLVGTYGILSDGSGAMLLKKGIKGFGLAASRMVSAGRFHAVNLNRDDSLILCKYYVKTLKELLQQAAVAPGEVAHIITQNANPLLTNQCLEMAGLDVAKLFTTNQTRYAHLDCLDFLVNLKDLTTEIADTKNEGYLLSFGTGWAGSYIASLLSYN